MRFKWEEEGNYVSRRRLLSIRGGGRGAAFPNVGHQQKVKPVAGASSRV